MQALLAGAAAWLAEPVGYAPVGLWSGPADIHPAWLPRLLTAEATCRRELGWGFRYESGWRSSQHQKELYDCYQRRDPGCNPANRPGTSNHENRPWDDKRRWSLAVDIHPDKAGPTRGDYLAMQQVCARFGIHFPIGSELWHAQPDEQAQGTWTGDPFPEPRPVSRRLREMVLK